MTCVSHIALEISALKNIHSNHVSISKTKRSRIRGRKNIATRKSTIPREMKGIFYHEEYVKIKKEPYELFEEVEEISRKSKDVRDQSSNTFGKATCFDKTSMVGFGDERARFS